MADMTAVELAPWVERVKARRSLVKQEIAPREINLLTTTMQLLSAPRRMRKALMGVKPNHYEMQLPWLPAFPGLESRPFHDTSRFPWVRDLEASVAEIRNELHQVQHDFGRAAYDSDRNVKTWKTFYFYLGGRPVQEHLDACPRTKELLSQVPINGLHVCFSAIQPGGLLQPHTGPMNASLTAHLGLEGCEGSAIWVAGEKRPYVEGKVLVFDDSFVHWVGHTGPQVRYTLMVTFWHPDMNVLERALIAQVLKKAPTDMFDHKPNPLDKPNG